MNSQNKEKTLLLNSNKILKKVKELIKFELIDIKINQNMIVSDKTKTGIYMELEGKRKAFNQVLEVLK